MKTLKESQAKSGKNLCRNNERNPWEINRVISEETCGGVSGGTPRGIPEGVPLEITGDETDHNKREIFGEIPEKNQ